MTVTESCAWVYEITYTVKMFKYIQILQHSDLSFNMLTQGWMGIVTVSQGCLSKI